MRYASVCSGIEAATAAWSPIGWQAAYFSEIEKFPSAVLAHHYPAVPNLGDMTRLADWTRTGHIEAPDVLVGGTPCQAFSVAGNRGGLADERGALSLAFIELANAIDDARRSPCVVVWENVPGVLSMKDNAFGCFLGELCGEEIELQSPGARWENAGCVFGPRRAIAWRVLDAQYFGLAQRRRRLFVIASARDGFDPGTVLFERDGLRRDTPPSRKTEQSVAAPIAGVSNRGGANGPSRSADDAESLVPVYCPGVANPLTARMAKGINTTLDEGQTPIAVHGTQCVASDTRVRRLTPRECERLQGFPDDYTAIPWRGKPAEQCPDGPRYRALGNSMAVPVMRWVGERIVKTLEAGARAEGSQVMREAQGASDE